MNATAKSWHEATMQSDTHILLGQAVQQQGKHGAAVDKLQAEYGMAVERLRVGHDKALRKLQTEHDAAVSKLLAAPSHSLGQC